MTNSLNKELPQLYTICFCMNPKKGWTQINFSRPAELSDSYRSYKCQTQIFRNDKEAKKYEIIVPNVDIRIQRNGDRLYNIRLIRRHNFLIYYWNNSFLFLHLEKSLTIACLMDLSTCQESRRSTNLLLFPWKGLCIQIPRLILKISKNKLIYEIKIHLLFLDILLVFRNFLYLIGK